MPADGARQSLIFVAPRAVEVREEPMPAPSGAELLVQTLVSAISAGTELLVYRGEVPGDMALDAQISGLTDRFAFPVKYGYSTVGRVVAVGADADAGWLDRIVFSLHPHESHFVARADELEPVPPGIGAEAATLFAGMETAVTLLLDGRPLVGERVAVFGQGMVGLLTTSLLARFPLAELVTLDTRPARRRLSATLGADRSVDPATEGGSEGDFDLTYELSGNPAALDGAIRWTGFDGRVVIGSWYGKRRADLDLGGAFHRSRITLKSSQVSTIDPQRSGRWTSQRRRELAWRMLAQVDVERLVTHRFALADAADAYELLDSPSHDAIQVLLAYESVDAARE